jgi:hypothetical protein
MFGAAARFCDLISSINLIVHIITKARKKKILLAQNPQAVQRTSI